MLTLDLIILRILESNNKARGLLLQGNSFYNVKCTQRILFVL